MAQSLQLDAAAKLAGKSEVTLRRLIKAGKIPFQREKTLTGFLYLVDPDHVRAYYGEGLSTEQQEVAEEQAAEVRAEAPTNEVRPGAVRLAVAGESGNFAEYWQKRSDMFEQRYHQEATRLTAAREELGYWKGKAEHAQSLVTRLLPSGDEKPVSQLAVTDQAVKEQAWPVVLTIVLIIAGAILVGAVAWVLVKGV